MAHPPPQYNAQQQLGMTNVSLQQMLGQRAMNVSGGMPIHQGVASPPFRSPTGSPFQSTAGLQFWSPTSPPFRSPNSSFRVPASSPLQGPVSSPSQGPVGSPLGPAGSPFRTPAGSPYRGSAGSPYRGTAGSPYRGCAGSPYRGPAGSPFRGPASSPFRDPAGSPFRGPASSPLRSPAGSPLRGPMGSPLQSAASSPFCNSTSSLAPGASGNRSLQVQDVTSSSDFPVRDEGYLAQSEDNSSGRRDGDSYDQQNVGASGATAAPPERTIIDDLEATFQGCIAPLLPGTDNASKLNVSTDKLRSSMELSIKEFTEQAQKVEAYFVKKHAMVALQQPELIIQEEIEELKEEITRRDKTLKNHAAKVNSWLESIRTLQKAINETPSTEPIQMNPTTSATQPHPESIQQQMMNQRR